MKPKIIEFARAAASAGQFPDDGRPEVAFMGRSNVGKSSLLNRLTGRQGIARVSKTPGRTREVNFFLADERTYLVDLPGFGYARVSQSQRRAWAKLIEAYVSRRDTLALAVHLVDSRHDPTPLDAMLRDALLSRGVPTAVVLTKGDKISGSKLPRALSRARKQLDLPEEVTVLATSSKSGKGITELWKVIDNALVCHREDRG